MKTKAARNIQMEDQITYLNKARGDLENLLTLKMIVLLLNNGKPEYLQRN